MIHYVYLLTSKNLLKYYIGVRSCKCGAATDNYWGSSKYLGDKATRCNRFYKTILSVHPTREAATAEEIRLHNYYDVAVNNSFYNKAKQTSIGWDTTGTVASEETRAKLSAARKGYKHRQETKDKIAKGRTGCKHSDETKKLVSAANKGKQPRLGAKLSDATKEKLRKTSTGKVHSTATREKISAAVSIPVVQLDATTREHIATYKSARVAANELGYAPSSITAVCKGRYKTLHGFAWEYKAKERNTQCQ